MIARRSADPQFDLFVPYISDLPLRDQRETMERPFFSLANASAESPSNMSARTARQLFRTPIRLGLSPNIRRAIRERCPARRPHARAPRFAAGGSGRLQATSIVTNIRVQKGKKHRQFSWIESWTDTWTTKPSRAMGMSLTLSDWFYEGILMDGGLLSIDPAYFSITGGRERWLYRVARKHAGGAGEGGFAISLPTLFEKSGAEGTYRRFKFEMQAIVRHNDLPGFDLSLEFTTSKEPSLRMCRRAVAHAEGEQVAAGGKIRRPSATDYRAAAVPAAVQQPERDAGARRPWLHAPARRGDRHPGGRSQSADRNSEPS